MTDVNQSDRDAAQAIYNGESLFAQAKVKARDSHELVQAFAAHRLATEARAQVLADALENLLDDGHSFESEGLARDAARQALATWRRT